MALVVDATSMPQDGVHPGFAGQSLGCCVGHSAHRVVAARAGRASAGRDRHKHDRPDRVVQPLSDSDGEQEPERVGQSQPSVLLVGDQQATDDVLVVHGGDRPREPGRRVAGKHSSWAGHEAGLAPGAEHAFAAHAAARAGLGKQQVDGCRSERAWGHRTSVDKAIAACEREGVGVDDTPVEVALWTATI